MRTPAESLSPWQSAMRRKPVGCAKLRSIATLAAEPGTSSPAVTSRFRQSTSPKHGASGSGASSVAVIVSVAGRSATTSGTHAYARPGSQTEWRMRSNWPPLIA
jgi:hypothetical protein